VTAGIQGLHHVTATVDEAQPDLDFCVEALGLRLVKKTVNFDNHHVYHFYYGDEQGTPGTIWTTFPYYGRGVRTGIKGAGQITATSFSVPAGSLTYWHTRLEQRGIVVQRGATRFGDEEALTATDPSGLAIELIANDRDDRRGWSGGLASEVAVRGLHSVSMTIRSPDKTLELMTGVLGFEIAGETTDRLRVGINGGGPGRSVDLVIAPGAPAAVNGLGTVHHVAFAIPDEDSQLALRDQLTGLGYEVTPVMDRQYFRSIYFREPGGVLFEVATIPPGFAIDEPRAALGEQLKLPPWEERNRRAIEAGLAPVVVRSAGAARGLRGESQRP
jgi:glyoxalase family protein